MRHKPSPSDVLKHYGVKRRSGRYPWGSGEDPYQRSATFLREYENYRNKGLKPKEIAEKMGMNTTQLRNNITWARNEEKQYNAPKARALKEQGLTNVAIGKILGKSEATIRNYLSDKPASEKIQKLQLENISDALKSGVDNTGYLDVGIGVERQLGVSRTKFNAMVNKLVEDGEYYVHEVHVQRLSDPTGTKYTTVKVLTKNPDVKETRKNSDKIRALDTFSDDGGLSLNKLQPPKMLDLNRIKVVYKEEGGADKDGLIELRPGVEDLDMGRSKYAQVRIGAGENLYLKGMAIVGDEKNFPKGVDVLYYRPESKVIPKEQVLKKMKQVDPGETDPSFMFGSNVYKQKGALNIVNEQGDWDKWGKTMSSQFLSKQPLTFIKERLDDTYKGLRNEFDEINSMTNPVVKKYLMDSYVEGLDAKANHLKAKGVKDTKSHVLLPFPDMKPNEIYAPNYENGQRVVLVRHPHGGIFEIPDLVVNNKQSTAKRLLGMVQDAVGIHPSVAEKLSGADFDGDTALVIPNDQGKIKTSRSLKELKNFDPKMYAVDYQTISPKAKQTQMGMVSNLITDMTIKGATDSELARAVKHSMVVIDSEKHKLDYKKSARDNQIAELVKKYQSHTNPETGKPSKGASTLISRSKQKIDISQHEKALELARDKVDKNGKVLKKGMSPSEVAKKLKISEDTVNGYLKGKTFSPDKYASEYPQDQLYLGYIKGVVKIKNEAIKTAQAIKPPVYSKEAAKVYADEVKSINAKLNVALLNAPRERQAQIMTSNIFYSQFHKGMEPDQIKKIKSRALAKARTATGAKKTQIKLTEREWEAIQARAISNTKLLDVLKNADMDIVRKLASPRIKMGSAKLERARTYLRKGYTYSEVAKQLGVTTTALREELSQDG